MQKSVQSEQQSCLKNIDGRLWDAFYISLSRYKAVEGLAQPIPAQCCISFRNQSFEM